MNKHTLENYQFGEVKPYVMYLESTTPYDPGLFFTFETEQELIDVLSYELLTFCSVEENDIEHCQAILDELLPKTASDFDENVLDSINSFISLWKLGFVGTLQDLMISNRETEKWFRAQFRKYVETEGGDSPIKESEIEDFKWFMLPEWNR